MVKMQMSIGNAREQRSDLSFAAQREAGKSERNNFFEEEERTIEIITLAAIAAQLAVTLMLRRELKLMMREEPLTGEQKERLEEQRRQLESMMRYGTGEQRDDKDSGAGNIC